MRSSFGISLVSSKKRWELISCSEALVRQLATELTVSLPVARVLAARSMGSDPKRLLQHDLADVSSPFRLRGVDRALERLEHALAHREQIFIHGDFDVDGMTSAALLYRALRRLGAEGIQVELEDRERGHGLNPQVVQQVVERGFTLLITTDCGISDVECVQALQEQGVDVIITDHHEPPPQVAPAYAIINPRQAGCPYPHADLAAVGVVYQLVSALYGRMGLGQQAGHDFLDLVMLGTVGDLVPLVRDGSVENRLLVKGGLDLLARGGGSTGLRVLLKKLSIDLRKLTAGEVSYIVVPKLNAANRAGDPWVAFLLLITEDEKQAEYLASILIDYNYDRQVAQDDLRFQAEQLLRSEIDLQHDKIIILAGQYWNPGVIGLVASDLVDRYYLPTVLLSQGAEFARASARSIPEFNLIECLTHHQYLFERFGGHHMAAGFSIRNEWIPRMKEEFTEYARKQLAQLAGPVQSIDAELQPEEIDLPFYEELQRLGPFGVGNREPRFLLRDVQICEARTVGNGAKHLKLKVTAGEREFDAIGFDLGGYIAQLSQAGKVALVCKITRDDWGNRAKTQLQIMDVLAPAAEQSHSL
jgi:single-stranded-DNA-specific exonuclease